MINLTVVIDNDEALKKLRELQKVAKTTTSSVVSDSDKMDVAMRRFTSTLAKIGVGVSFTELTRKIATVRGEFQQLEVAFTTLLKSKEKADALMNQMVELAAKTPFDLQGVASGARQLLAYGFAAEDVSDTLTRLGNVAAGLGLPLERLTYLYGTTSVQGRVYARDMLQFTTSGIPMLQEMAKMYGKTTDEINKMVFAGEIGFEDVRKVIENMTNEGGQFYNLMQEQSKTITGLISNLGDAIDTMFNEIGKSQEGVITNVLQGAISLVENYEKVLKILAVLVSAYGAYKAALITTAAILKMQQVGEYISRIIHLTKAVKTATQAHRILNKVVKANPWGLLASIIATVVTSLTVFSGKTKEVSEYTKMANDEIGAETAKIDSLKSILEDTNASYDARKRALDELKRIAPGYHAELTTEGTLINNNKEALDKYIESFEKAAKLKAAESELESLYAQQREDEQKAVQKQEKRLSRNVKFLRNTNTEGTTTEFTEEEKEVFRSKARQKTQPRIDELLKEIKALRNEGADSTDTTDSTEPETILKNEEEVNKALIEAREQRNKALIDLEKKRINDEIELLKYERAVAIKEVDDEISTTEDPEAKAVLKDTKKIVGDSYDYDIAIAEKKAQEKQKQALNELLSDIQTYEQRRLAIQQEYADKRALLYEEDGKTLKEGVTQGNVEALNRNEVDALAEIDEEFANRSIVFQEWVNSIADASLTQLGYYLADAQAMLIDMEEDMPGDEALAKLRASIALLEAEIAKRRAAEKMGNTSDKSAKKANRSVEEWSELRETLNEVSRELDQIGDEIGGVGGEIIKTAGVVATNTVSLISDISRLSEISADNIEGISEVAAEAIAKVERASVILAILSAALKVAKAIGDAINGDKRKDRRINGLTDDINDLKKSYEQLQKATESTYSSAAAKGLEAQNDNLEKQKKLVEDQIKLEQDKKHTSHDRLKEMRAELDALNEQIAANKVAMSDAIFGEDIQSSIGNLTAALLDAWEQGDNKVKASKDVVKNMIKSMISEAMKLDVKGFMENLRSKMEEFWNDGYISRKEEDILEQMAEEEAKRIDSKYQWADKYLKGVADKAEQSATFGGFETMSETTGTKLDGRFATMVMLEEDIKNGAVELIEINAECRNLLREANNIAIDTRDIQVEQLNYLKIIASNTDRLESIETELSNISRHTKNLE